MTIVSPGYVRTNLLDSVADPDVRARMAETMATIAIPPDAIARAVAFVIEQPEEVDVSEIVVRPTAQS